MYEAIINLHISRENTYSKMPLEGVELQYHMHGPPILLSHRRVPSLEGAGRGLGSSSPAWRRKTQQSQFGWQGFLDPSLGVWRGMGDQGTAGRTHAVTRLREGSTALRSDGRSCPSEPLPQVLLDAEGTEDRQWRPRLLFLPPSETQVACARWNSHLKIPLLVIKLA